jgi:hypothetical protein
VTVDQNLTQQQNPKTLPIAVLTLAARKNTYAALKPLAPPAPQTLARIGRGEALRVGSPSETA